jgi:hypothetical protein
MSISATTIEVPPARLLVLALACLSPLLLAAEGTNLTPDRVVSRFRLGPLFECRTTRDGGTFWALRPFVSRVSDPTVDTRVTDVAWPLGTFHRDREEAWWRLALAYGSDSDVSREDSAWKLALFPLYFQGRSRHGEDYWALFPLYGHLPHVLLMDDIDFGLFPLYLNYEVNRAEREYYLWPVFSRMEAEPGVRRTGIFPVYGRTWRKDVSSLYAFWPFWTSAVYGESRNPGTSWMLFPIAAQVDRAKEQQWMVLPPFFSHAKTDAAERWRLPWPLYETVTTQDSKKRSLWPLYGEMDSPDERRRYAVWPLIEDLTLRRKGKLTECTRFFPFYVDETVCQVDTNGAARAEARYTRVWPLFSRESDEHGSRLRALEFSLIRSSGGIERNWAPFWTLYERSQRENEVMHDALWGLFQYRQAVEQRPKGGDTP